MCLSLDAGIDGDWRSIEPDGGNIDGKEATDDACPGERLLDDKNAASLLLQMREGSEPAAIAMKLAIDGDNLDETDRGCDAFWVHVIAPA